MADVATVINTISSIIKVAVDLTPTVIKTVEDATPFARAIYNGLVGKQNISDEDLAILEQKIMELSAQLQAPLPPEVD